MKTNNTSAFSLLEILVVIAIIIILATIGHQSYLKYTQRAKIAEALNVLDEYQAQTVNQYTRNGAIDPYYVLFSDSDTTGFISGTPGGSSAEKELNLKYVDTVSANTGTDGSNEYVLLGAGLKHDGYIIDGADHIYMVGTISPGGTLSWSCGSSVSQANNIAADYLPSTCLNTLP